jgi:hypothetical protein
VLWTTAAALLLMMLVIVVVPHRYTATTQIRGAVLTSAAAA